MNISKKYIKSKFKERGIQLNNAALDMLEERIKMFIDKYSRLCSKFGYKRVTDKRIEKVFDFEDSFEKAKGRKLQDFVRDNLLSCFPFLEQDDIKSAIMGESGEDIKLSPAARRAIPYSFECKNQERLNIWSSLQQAEDNSNDRTPILVFKRNRSKTYVAIEIDKFLKLIGEDK